MIRVTAAAETKLPTAPMAAAWPAMVDHDRLHNSAHRWRLKIVVSFSRLCPWCGDRRIGFGTAFTALISLKLLVGTGCSVY